MMMKKDYEVIAEALSELHTNIDRYAPGNTSPREVVDIVANHLAGALRKDNYRFNRDFFLRACKGEN